MQRVAWGWEHGDGSMMRTEEKGFRSVDIGAWGWEHGDRSVGIRAC